ncbi:MAG: hypothetical protein ACT4PG_01305 [Panacagrimonas sp.]
MPAMKRVLSALGLLIGVSSAQALDNVQVTQAADEGYVLQWDASGAVDVYVSDRADA